MSNKDLGDVVKKIVRDNELKVVVLLSVTDDNMVSLHGASASEPDHGLAVMLMQRISEALWKDLKATAANKLPC